MSDKVTVGEVVAAFLENCGVGAAFGVISIHNMPFLDAIGQRGNIRYVCARGEAGAVNMADAYARVGQRLGVAFTSTGTAAGNASGAMVEAQSAGTSLLHITGQVETQYLDKNYGYIHGARDQLGMLKAISKSAYRVTSPETALETFKTAVHDACMAPTGPVSVEVPIDIQHAEINWPRDLTPLPVKRLIPDLESVDELAERLSRKKRPLLWLGGGARHASDAAKRLADIGFGVVTSVQGRGTLPEDHKATLGAYNIYQPVEDFYKTCDAVLVVGSRLRSNETLNYKLKLPSPHYQVDVDLDVLNRPYKPDMLVLGDSQLVMEALADKLDGRLNTDKEFILDLQSAREKAIEYLRDGFKPYEPLVDAIQATGGADFIWVRDVTVSNSTWGNRSVLLNRPYDGVHAMGGGIGQSVQMAIGAAVAAPDRKVICLVGDGGLQFNIGEMATAIQEGVNICVILMNSKDYEVIKNIQDNSFGGRKYFADLYTPDFEAHAESVGWSYQMFNNLSCVKSKFSSVLKSGGLKLLEVDMKAIGPYARAFGGPPVRQPKTRKKR